VILDAGFLVSLDRGDHRALAFAKAAVPRAPLVTSHGVVAQVWRDGSRQARLSRFLRSIEILPLDNGARIGALLRQSRTSDVVDAHVLDLAIQHGQPILTADVDDLTRLRDRVGAAVDVIPWP
jgi:predicted nucleic acid-binding protein